MPQTFEAPCSLGDKVFVITFIHHRPFRIEEDHIRMIGFTSKSIRIGLRGHNYYNQTYTWGKNVFATRDDATEAFEKLKREAS